MKYLIIALFSASLFAGADEPMSAYEFCETTYAPISLEDWRSINNPAREYQAYTDRLMREQNACFSELDEFYNYKDYVMDFVAD